MSLEDAIEHLSFNTLNAYVGEKTPIWCMDDLIWLDMKGIITSALEWCKMKNLSLEETQKYIWVKHKINVGKKALKKRIDNIKVIKRYD